MRIAFQTSTRPLWLGGMMTFQDLFIALRTLPERPSIALVRWQGTPLEDYEMLSPYIDGWVEAKYPSLPAPAAPVSWRARVRGAARFLKRGSTARRAEETLRAAGVDCSFSVIIDTRTDTSVPLLIWIYDLQHHHFPEWISESERAQRDAAIARDAERATLLLAKSSSVARDLAEFFPQATRKVRTLPWVAHIPETIYAADPMQVIERFHLPHKFFLLPNQFWAHKNHLGVINALQLLRARKIFPVIVCTGSLFDQRNPDFLGALVQAASQANVREQFILLGMIARDDLLALMRQCVAVLNPSRFEGFGLSAAEAKSLGKRALLSDLPSLREQAPPQATWFDPQDARDLADKMAMVWEMNAGGPDLEMETEARRALPARQREFARGFMQLANEAVRPSRSAVEHDS